MAQLFHAYLDESGTHDGSEAVAVAGFISNTAKWEALSEDWSRALAEWEIDYFHMSDFENYQQQFSSWTEVQHRDRLNYLLGLIKQYTMQSVGYVLPMEAFDRIVSEEAKGVCGDAYGMAALGCWWTVAKLAKQPQNDGYINYVMDRKSKGSGPLLQIYRSGSKVDQWSDDTRIRGLLFHDKEDFPPLQAADIMAYELF